MFLSVDTQVDVGIEKQTHYFHLTSVMRLSRDQSRELTFVFFKDTHFLILLLKHAEHEELMRQYAETFLLFAHK